MNDIIQESGKIKYVKPQNINDGYFPGEDYNIGVILEIEYYKRESCGKGKDNNEVEVITFSSEDGTIAFNGGGKGGYLTTDFTDISNTTPWKNTKECLGIKEIQITYNSDLYPTVSIKFVDIRGASLIGPTEMEQMYSEGDGSFFKMLYAMPSPLYKLKVKGFYGNWVTYQLVLDSSQLIFDSENGNFELDCNFIGYLYGIYSDIPMMYISCAPFIEYEGADYWNKECNFDNGRFKFNNGGYKVPMITFSEFRKRVSAAADSMEYENIKESQNKALQNLSNRILLLKNIINTFPFNGWISSNNIEYFITYDKKYLDSFEDNRKRFISLIENYNEAYSEEPINGFNYIKEALKIEKFSFAYNESIGEFVSKGFYYTEEQIDTSYFKKNNSNKNPFYIFVIKKKNNIAYNTKILENSIEKISKEKETQDNKYNKKRLQSICNALRFPPTISNIYNLLFAHIDTFMHVFYYYLNRIKVQMDNNDARRYNVNKDQTDSDLDILPPFPLFYREVTKEDGTKNMEEMWVGDLDNGIELIEAEFVNSILNATKFYSSIIYEAENSIEDSNEYDDINIKISIYNTLKNIYERWICSSSEDRWQLGNENSDFSSFKYIDSFFQDIGNKLLVNATEVSNLFSNCILTSDNSEHNGNTIYNFLYEIAQKNGGNLMAFPIYVNDFSKEGMKEIFKPMPLSTNLVEDKSTFIFLYPYETSHYLNNGSLYENDSFDITAENGEILQNLPVQLQNRLYGSSYIFSFEVNYASPGQSFFQNFKLSMDNPSITEASISGYMNIASKAGDGPRESTLFGQDIYRIYSTYSFKASMDMMGDAQIMPLMYFQLNGIPMWRGVYMISSVSHEIIAGNMITSFEGYRINKNSIPMKSDSMIALSDTEWIAISE